MKMPITRIITIELIAPTDALVIVAPLTVGIFGAIVERLVIRHLYGRMIDTMLATWGLSLLMVGLVTLIGLISAVNASAAVRLVAWAQHDGGYIDNVPSTFTDCTSPPAARTKAPTAGECGRPRTVAR